MPDIRSTTASAKPTSSIENRVGVSDDTAPGRFLLVAAQKPDGTMVLVGCVYENASGLREWLNRDPIGERGGINLYRFVGNNPLRFVDPLGLLVFGTFDIGTGTLALTDEDTGHSVVITAESGGKPFGDPIPVGNYDILDHPKPDFLRLEPLDDHYGDDKDSATGRTKFRLHKPGRTIGCIAAKEKAPWEKLRDLIRNTKTTTTTVDSKSYNPFAPDTETIKKFGDLRVIDTSLMPMIPGVPPKP